MRKFTIFTVILTIVLVVAVLDVLSNDYLTKYEKPTGGNEVVNLPEGVDLAGAVQTNVLGFDLGKENTVAEVQEQVVAVEEPAVEVVENGVVVVDFENENFVSYSPNVYIREEQIKSAGFVDAYLEDERADGYLFKTIYIDDLYDVEVKKSVIRTETALVAKVYVFKIGPKSDVDEVYQVLRIRSSEGLDSEVNETNEYGDRSFYLNDLRRSSTAFLVSRIGDLVYAFSYPKEYHPQIKNLLGLIAWELGK
ncbi:hypothetical protein KJ632_04080 [Patescibacteria group bacterium]|nr:hypothetical protein [Patescibacteria group bacterium]